MQPQTDTGDDATTRDRTGIAVPVLVIVLAGVLAVGFVVATAAPAAGAPTQINSCTTITQPGEYVLTADITNANADPCINIRASDVVFDGQGHTVGGTGSGVGIGNDRGPLSNVSVTDVIVRDWQSGVEYFSTTDSAVTGVTATENTNGVLVSTSSHRITLANNNATGNNGNGIRVASSNNMLINNTNN
ncbi:hypothetical protein BRC90_05380 [Halobacteriales archaeon QS_4_69_34]|nr:MAG: hypothetical protein BRC90_05380 [Halobacteriales archaeon QS_4_69_34]